MSSSLGSASAAPAGTRWAAYTAAVLALAPVATAAAQDIEVTAQLLGRPLPTEYYERVRQDPDFFTIRQGWIQRAERSRQAGLAVSGTLPVVLVLALFADSPEPAISAAEVQAALFDGPVPYGTIAEFYQEVSGGRVQVTGSSPLWVRTSLTLPEVVGTSFGLGSDSRLGDFMLEALRGMDAAVDFGAWDNDGPDGMPNSGDDDGFVDAVAFLYQERGAHCGAQGPWPHRSRIQTRTGAPFRTSVPRPDTGMVQVNDYIMLSIVGCEGDGIGPISVLAHELGHVFGLPDLYDSSEGALPEQRIWVVGCWSLMSAGGWGCGDGGARTVVNRPPHMGAWEKSQLGWLADEVSVEPGLNHLFLLEPVRQSGRVLRVPLSGSEWLLVEYRDRAGFDRDLPLPGILVYHIDQDRPFRKCATCERLYRVALVEADGNGALLRTALEGGNRGEPGDVFGVEGRTALTGLGQPSTRLNAGAPSAATFYEIVLEDGAARIRVSTTEIALDRLLQSFLSTGAVPPGDEEQVYLDLHGNQNGRFDVGDLRRYLLQHPGVH